MVENNIEIALDIMGDMEETGHFNVDMARDVEEAFLRLGANHGLLGNKYKLVLLDVRSSDEKGLQFLTKWKKTELLRNIPLVLLSDFEETPPWDADLVKSVTYTLYKPYKKEVLEQVLKEILIYKTTTVMRTFRKESFSLPTFLTHRFNSNSHRI